MVSCIFDGQLDSFNGWLFKGFKHNHDRISIYNNCLPKQICFRMMSQSPHARAIRRSVYELEKQMSITDQRIAMFFIQCVLLEMGIHPNGIQF